MALGERRGSLWRQFFLIARHTLLIAQFAKADVHQSVRTSNWEATETRGAFRRPRSLMTSGEQDNGWILRPGCDSEDGWVDDEPVTTVCITNNESAAPPLSNVRAFRRMNCSLEFPARICKGKRIRSKLVGPFVTEPGQWASIVVELPDLLDDGDKIISFVGDIMGRDGRAIPYPPIHMHHYHVSHRRTAHWFEVHGDYAIDKDGFYRRQMPEGGCVVADGVAPYLQVQVNDVQLGGGSMDSTDHTTDHDLRKETDSGPSNVEFYLRLVFELAPPEFECETLQKLITFWPITDFAAHDVYSRYDVGSSDRVFWWTTSMKDSGEIVGPAWIHSHRARHRGFLLVKGTHSMHSLTGVGPDCAFSNDLACHDISAARQRVIENGGSLVVCRDYPEVPSFETITSRNGVVTYFDRPGKFGCSPLSFTFGQNFTIFVFSGPVYHPGNTPNTIFPQHSMIFAYYRTRDSEGRERFNRSNTIQQFAKTYGVWEIAKPDLYSDSMPVRGSENDPYGVFGTGIVRNDSMYDVIFSLHNVSEDETEDDVVVENATVRDALSSSFGSRNVIGKILKQSMRTWMSIGCVLVILVILSVRQYRAEPNSE